MEILYIPSHLFLASLVLTHFPIFTFDNGTRELVLAMIAV